MQPSITTWSRQLGGHGLTDKAPSPTWVTGSLLYSGVECLLRRLVRFRH